MRMNIMSYVIIVELENAESLPCVSAKKVQLKIYPHNAPDVTDVIIQDELYVNMELKSRTLTSLSLALTLNYNYFFS